jgi:Tol biopolymer transport system component
MAEAQPALSPDAEDVAYYGIREGDTELYLSRASDQTVLPLTVRADESGLHVDFGITTVLRPAFSTDGRWIAFPADDGHETIELFVARHDGQDVRQVTDLGHQVCDYVWLDDRTIVVAVRQSDKTVHYWAARFESGEFKLEALH